ncbi:rod shape-determining protein MreC [Pelagibacterales bacterium SAG-MED47]|nr:rod shape-determining protein MreC [Pelagibacterales bacterium SAG-MED47]
MASSRDDFVIAIRSAFLKKSTKQKFSLLTLVFTSIFVIVLSNLDLKVVRYLKIGINELVYRSSFVVSIPENFIKDTFIEVSDYTTFFNDYKKKRIELAELKSDYVSNEIIQNENKELKELINDYVLTSDKIFARIIVDHESPFLKSIIINKGSKDGIKIGTNIYDQSYLVGRVIEINYKTSRVLLLSDLNSNVPVTIAPQNIQAIVTGTGDNYGQIKYIKDGLSEEIDQDSIVYTSGTGAIFKSGIPVGKLKIIDENSSLKFSVNFYSDFSQLKYVFAEVINISENLDLNTSESNNENSKTERAKLQILENELEIIEETNSKFLEENINLKNEINNLNIKLLMLDDELSSKNTTINQFNIDKKELEFLKLNLEFGHKCRKSRKLFQKTTGFDPGSVEYKKCVLNKGIVIND